MGGEWEEIQTAHGECCGGPTLGHPHHRGARSYRSQRRPPGLPREKVRADRQKDSHVARPGARGLAAVGRVGVVGTERLQEQRKGKEVVPGG